MEDQLFQAIGSFGRWQKTIYAIFFYGNLVGVWQNYAMTFLAPNVPFRCTEPSVNTSINASEPWPNDCVVYPSNTSEGVRCTHWEYDIAGYSDTLVSEWDLVCDREWLVSFAKSVYMIGFMVSVFVSGQLSDWIGRRPTIFSFYIITCISCILSLFSTSMKVFLTIRFFIAFGRTGFTTTGYVLLMELVGSRHRSNVGISVQMGWCFGFCMLVVIGYFFRDWFWFQVVMYLPILPLFTIFIFVPESPRWLLMHGKSERLEQLITHASKTNKTELKENVSDIIKKLIKGRTAERKGNLLDLFRTPKMRCRTLNMMYMWLVNAFIYYALSFNTNDMLGDPYVNFLVLAVLEFPSYGMLFLGMRWFGRRTILIVLMLLGGACCLSLLAVPNHLPWLTTVFSQAGKFCVTASFGLLYFYTGEMFPTVVRSAALGSCSMVARIGSITAPFSRELGKATHSLVPNILNSILAVSSGILAFWLPETAGHNLPDTLDEGENDFEMKPEKECHD